MGPKCAHFRYIKITLENEQSRATCLKMAYELVSVSMRRWTPEDHTDDDIESSP